MRRLLPLVLLLLAAGCAGFAPLTLKPGVSTEADVRSSMGVPAAEFTNADGSRSLAYPHGPLGTQTYFADVAPNGVVRAVRQVLKDETFYGIQPGMTRDDVLRTIGPPGETMAFARLRQMSWGYRFVDTWGYAAIFSVNFDESGIVVSKFTRRIDRPDRRD